MDIRKITLMILCFGLLVSARAQNRSYLEFSPKEVNLDTIRFDADSVLLHFVAKNVSGKPITILEVHSSCGCFTGEASRKAIGPGESSEVKAWFKPRSLHGKQNRHLTVVATDGESQVLSSLTAKAYVLRDQSEGEIRFPDYLGEGVRTDRLSYMIEMDRQGDFVLRVPLYNDTDTPVDVKVSGPERLKIFSPEKTIGPHSREDIRGVYNAKWIKRGTEITDSLQVLVNGKKVTTISFYRHF